MRHYGRGSRRRETPGRRRHRSQGAGVSALYGLPTMPFPARWRRSQGRSVWGGTSLLWSAGALLTMLAVAMLKMYFWMEMNRNATLREVKRLELQVARLAANRTGP